MRREKIAVMGQSRMFYSPQKYKSEKVNMSATRKQVKVEVILLRYRAYKALENVLIV